MQVTKERLPERIIVRARLPGLGIGQIEKANQTETATDKPTRRPWVVGESSMSWYFLLLSHISK